MKQCRDEKTPHPSPLARGPVAALAPLGGLELGHHVELRLHYGNNDQLGQPLHGLQRECLIAASI